MGKEDASASCHFVLLFYMVSIPTPLVQLTLQLIFPILLLQQLQPLISRLQRRGKHRCCKDSIFPAPQLGHPRECFPSIFFCTSWLTWLCPGMQADDAISPIPSELADQSFLSACARGASGPWLPSCILLEDSLIPTRVQGLPSCFKLDDILALVNQIASSGLNCYYFTAI